jgi:hypothetical protein
MLGSGAQGMCLTGFNQVIGEIEAFDLSVSSYRLYRVSILLFLVVAVLRADFMYSDASSLLNI